MLDVRDLGGAWGCCIPQTHGANGGQAKAGFEILVGIVEYDERRALNWGQFGL